MRVESGCVVTYTLLIRDPDGSLVRSPDTAMTYVHGHTEVLAEVGAALEGCQEGDHVTVDAEMPGDGPPPLAGQRLTFELDVVHVRRATDNELTHKTVIPFPLDVLNTRDFPGDIGVDMLRFARDCMFPPWPWGHWLYGRLLAEQCGPLDGDLIELGVGLGGTSMFMASRCPDRHVYALDTFTGLPSPDATHDNPYFVAELYRGASAPLVEHVKARLKAENLQDRVTLLQGRFKDTLPQLAEDQKFCLAHLDSDLYASVFTSLEGIWDRMVDGGVVVFDDYFHPAQGPARACSDFFNQRGIRPIYQVVFPYGVFVIKGREVPDRRHRSIDGNTYSFDWLRTDVFLRDALEQSAQRCVPNSRAKANADRLLGVLTAQTWRTSDIYAYWSSLEDFWDTIAFGFTEADLGR
jgi:hypothetical protein